MSRARHKNGGGGAGSSYYGRGSRGGGGLPMVASGNPNVIREAEDRSENNSRGDYNSRNGLRSENDRQGWRKRGGRAKRKDGGKVIGLMTGGAVKPRMDRPGRKSGGGVGANKTPLSTANRVTAPPPERGESTRGRPD